MTPKNSLLAIDPGIKEIGVAHFIGRELYDFGVKSPKRSSRKIPPLVKLAQIMNRLVGEKKPDAIAVESNCFNGEDHRVMSEILGQIRKTARQFKVPVYGFAASTIKKTVTGDGRATKRTLTKVIIAEYREVKPYRETRIKWRERYYQNLFDAIACGLTFLHFQKTNQLNRYEIKD
ncbi:MAG: crossover junction endodeoxyribonuclease RuvC [bacterium]|jgi:Holliday junction resolvasome RuvABC endonuclease subunit